MTTNRTPEFLKAKQELIESYKRLDPGLQFCSDEIYSPADMAKMAEDETPDGVAMIEAFMKVQEKIKIIKSK